MKVCIVSDSTIIVACWGLRLNMPKRTGRRRCCTAATWSRRPPCGCCRNSSCQYTLSTATNTGDLYNMSRLAAEPQQRDPLPRPGRGFYAGRPQFIFGALPTLRSGARLHRRLRPGVLRPRSPVQHLANRHRQSGANLADQPRHGRWCWCTAHYIMADLATMQFDIITIEAAPASILPPVTPHV